MTTRVTLAVGNKWRNTKTMKCIIAWTAGIAIAATIAASGQNTPKKPVSEEKKEARIIEYGEYSTKDDPSSINPTWMFTNQTTQIKMKPNNGFGVRFSLPGPYTGDQVLVSVTIAGGFGPPGVIGYEFKRACPVKDTQCIGDMIIPCGGTSPPHPGDCTIIVKYEGWTLEKKFQLSN